MLLPSVGASKKNDNRPKTTSTLLIDRGACYMLLIGLGLMFTILEVPSINTNSIVLASHQFTIHPNTTSTISDIDSIRNNIPSHNENVTCFITGIAGFIGMSLATQLTNSTLFPQTNVIGLDSFNTYYIPRLKRERAQRLIRFGVDVIWGDLCDESLLRSIFDSNNISMIIHLAAQAGVRYSIEYPHSYVHNNIDCTVTLLEMIKNKSLDIPIVYASSSSIYGDNDHRNEPLSDRKSVNQYTPKSVYAASKVATENIGSVYSKMYNLTMVGLRFFTVYGSFGRPDMALWSFVERLVTNIESEKENKKIEKIKLYNHGKMQRDFTHWTDIVDGIQLAMHYALSQNQIGSPNSGSNEVFNLGKGNVRSLYEFVQIILESLGLSSDSKGIDHHEMIELVDTPGGEVLFTSADLTKSNLLLGYQPETELEDGIPEFVDWYLNEWKIKTKVRKQYLVISSINSKLWKRGNVEQQYRGIKEWYDSFRIRLNITDLSVSSVEMVIVHDGLDLKLIQLFTDIVFVKMNQIEISEYLNNSGDDEYDFVVISEIEEIQRDPFTYLNFNGSGVEGKEFRDFHIGITTKKLVVPPPRITALLGHKDDVTSKEVLIEMELKQCVESEMVLKVMQWMRSHKIQTRPVYLAGTKQTMINYLNELSQLKYDEITMLSKSEIADKCNDASLIVSLMTFCREKSENTHCIFDK